MQRTLVTALFVGTFAGTALAETPDAVPETPFVSTSAEVKAELIAFQRSGVDPWAIGYNPLQDFHSITTREAVIAEYLASRKQVQAMTGDDSGSAQLRTACQRALPATSYLAAP